MKKVILLMACAVLATASAHAQRMYDSGGRQIGRVDAERYYDGSGRQIGRVDGQRIYDGSGRQLGRMDGERIYDASGRQMGRIATLFQSGDQPLGPRVLRTETAGLAAISVLSAAWGGL